MTKERVALIAGILISLFVLGMATYGANQLVNSFFDKNVISPKGVIHTFQLQKPRLWVDKATYQKELEVEQIYDNAVDDAVEVIRGKLSPTPTPKPRSFMKVQEVLAVEDSQSWTGLASFYNWAGCLGCNPKRIMANGKPLVDSNLTLAFQRLPLGSKVRVTNLRNNMFVVAEVTDRGGYEALGRIADLSEGTKDAINCSDLCKVKIEEVL